MYQDAQSVLAAIDNLADAQSFSQAYKMYLEYLRQLTKVNVARAEATASFARTKAAEGFHALRDGVEKVSRLIRRHLKRLSRAAQAGPPSYPTKRPAIGAISAQPGVPNWD
jgi:hypothetical protein